MQLQSPKVVCHGEFAVGPKNPNKWLFMMTGLWVMFEGFFISMRVYWTLMSICKSNKIDQIPGYVSIF